MSTPAGTPELHLRATLHELGAEAEAFAATDLARGFAALDERLRSRRLLVAVVGEHNRGKSSLINSLLGAVWLPVGQSAPALPPVFVGAGAHERVELVYGDGSAVESTRTELLSLDPDEAASVAYARVALPSADLHGLLLVDTPGLNDPDTTRLAQTVYGLLPQCDLALLVLDSAQALGASEYELVERSIASAGLHRLVVVLNRDDELEDEAQRAAVRERVTRLLTPVLGAGLELLPYAARRALRARERKDARLLARSGYPELCALLRESAAARGSILQAAASGRAQSLGMALQVRLAEPAAVHAVIRQDDPRPAQAAAALRTIDEIRDRYRLDLQAFMIALRDGLEEETAEIEVEDMRRFLPFYIQRRYRDFVEERQPTVLDQIQGALQTADLADLPAPFAGVRAPAPGLFPYVAPDFLEESFLITTFMAVIGLTLRGVVAGAVMALGPVVRMLTRDLRERDERGAMLRSAQAAVMEAGEVLWRQIDGGFATTLEEVRAATVPPEAPPPVAPVEDRARLAARERVAALLRALEPAQAADQDAP